MSFNLNGQVMQHATSTCSFGWSTGEWVLKTHTKIAYKQTAEKENTTNAKGQVDGWGFKPSKHEGSITMRFDEWIAFKAARLDGADSTAGIGQVQVDLTMAIGNNLASIEKRVVMGIMFQSDGLESDAEQSHMTVEIPFIFASAYPSFINYDLMSNAK